MQMQPKRYTVDGPHSRGDLEAMSGDVDWLGARSPAHPLQDTSVGSQLVFVCLDILHILDLGVCQHICGSVLFLMVWDTALQGDLEQRMQTVWHRLLYAYENVGAVAGERLAHASFWNIFAKSKTRLPTGFVSLHSKAAVCRHTVPALDYMMRHLAKWAPSGTKFIDDVDGNISTMVSEMLSKLTLFYACIAYHPLWLPHDAAKEVHDALLAAGCCHTSLCDLFMHKQRKLFHVTEKAHFAQHIALSTLASRYNPWFRMDVPGRRLHGQSCGQSMCSCARANKDVCVFCFSVAKSFAADVGTKGAAAARKEMKACIRVTKKDIYA